MMTIMFRAMSRIHLLAGAVWMGAAHAGPPVSLEREPERVNVVIEGRLFSRFYHSPHWDKPFLWPLRTPSGIELTRGFPLEPRPGESTDHPWHRGLWWGHGDINGSDFWRELGAARTGRLVLVQPVKTEVSAETARLSATFALVTPAGERLGSVRQRYTFRRRGPAVLVDAGIAIFADRGLPLRFGDTDDGGFAVRLRDEFRQDRGARLISSEGLRGTEEIWGKAARWADYSATLHGVRAGVAVMDHPANFRHPSRWHARGYGLCSANPFGLRSFTGDQNADGAHTVAAGESLLLRYRVVVYEGEFEAPDLERLYAEFAAR